MASDVDIIAPRAITFPTPAIINENPPKGYTIISGANLFFFNGTDWKQCDN